MTDAPDWQLTVSVNASPVGTVPGPDSPDWQATIQIVPSAQNDAPDWQVIAVGPGGTPIGPSKPTYDQLMALYFPTVWYKMDESAGPSAVDSSGNGWTGTYAGSGVTYGIPGPIPGDTGVDLDGVAGGIVSSFVPGNAFGFSMVVWYKGLPAIWAPALASTNDVFHTGSGIALFAGTLSSVPTVEGDLHDSTSRRVAKAPGPPTDSKWHMIGWRAGGGVWDTKLNFDGVPQSLGDDTDFLPNVVSGNALQIGIPYGADSYYPGPVAQFAYWDGGFLSDEQFAALFAAV